MMRKQVLQVLFSEINLKQGDAVKIISPGRLSREFIAEELYDDRGESIPAVPHPYMKFKVRVPFEIKLGDIMRGA